MKTNFSEMRFIFTPALLAVFLFSTALADEIDWNRAKLLRQKMKSGKTLSEEDSAYLKKATQARMGNSATRGDGSDEKATVSPIKVSEKDSPVKMFTVTASDGYKLEIPYRAPKADRRLPAIVFIHGSMGQRRPRELIENVKSNPTQTRFLDAGYVIVAATFRTYVEEPLSRGPILDCMAIVESVKRLPEVDPESVIVFGTSGGGSIALELAGEKKLALPGVVIGEPATVLFTGMMTDLSMRDRSMKEFPTLYTDELRKATEAKISNISCPMLVHHGDIHLLKNLNFNVVFPAIEKAGKTLIVKKYPGENHGFYWGNRTSEKTLNLVFASSVEFIEPLLKSKPAER